MHLARQRADLLAHIQNTASQYNWPPLATSCRNNVKAHRVPTQKALRCSAVFGGLLMH
jgi:hypothetical protein